MAKVHQFEELECWKASRVLTRKIFLISRDVLKNDSGSRSQFQRAGLSIMNNIAEGFGRYSNKDFIKFLNLFNI